jgi:hypothetical protein
MLKKAVALITLVAPIVLMLSVPRVSEAGVKQVVEPVIDVPCPMSHAKVKAAIRSALREKKWSSISKGKNKIRAKVLVRKHTLVMNIIYNTKKVTMKYVSSENLKHKEKDGKHYIHGRANGWITYVANLTEMNMSDNCN